MRQLVVQSILAARANGMRGLVRVDEELGLTRCRNTCMISKLKDAGHEEARNENDITIY
jgi:hypothetical protein